MKMMGMTQSQIDIEHKGELFRLGGEVTSKNSFVAWLSWIKRFPDKQAADEHGKARAKFIIEEMKRLYGDLSPGNFVDRLETIRELYPDDKALPEQEQLWIMNLVCENWSDDNFTIYFTDDNLKELCNTKKK